MMVEHQVIENHGVSPENQNTTRHDHLTPLLYIKDVYTSGGKIETSFLLWGYGLVWNFWTHEVMLTANNSTQCIVASCRPCSVCAAACEIAKIKESKRCKTPGVYKNITTLMQCKQCTWKEYFDLISLSSAFRINITSAWSLWLVLEQSFCCVSCDISAGKYSTNMWGDTPRKPLERFPLCFGGTWVNIFNRTRWNFRESADTKETFPSPHVYNIPLKDNMQRMGTGMGWERGWERGCSAFSEPQLSKDESDLSHRGHKSRLL